MNDGQIKAARNFLIRAAEDGSGLTDALDFLLDQKGSGGYGYKSRWDKGAPCDGINLSDGEFRSFVGAGIALLSDAKMLSAEDIEGALGVVAGSTVWGDDFKGKAQEPFSWLVQELLKAGDGLLDAEAKKRVAELFFNELPSAPAEIFEAALGLVEKMGGGRLGAELLEGGMLFEVCAEMMHGANAAGRDGLESGMRVVGICKALSVPLLSVRAVHEKGSWQTGDSLLYAALCSGAHGLIGPMGLEWELDKTGHCGIAPGMLPVEAALVCGLDWTDVLNDGVSGLFKMKGLRKALPKLAPGWLDGGIFDKVVGERGEARALEVCLALVQRGAKPLSRDLIAKLSFGRNPYSEVDPRLFAALAKCGVDPNERWTDSKTGFEALLDAEEAKAQGSAKHTRKPVSAVAGSSGFQDALRALVAAGGTANGAGARLAAAVRGRFWGIAAILAREAVGLGIDVNEQSPAGGTALSYAVGLGNGKGEGLRNMAGLLEALESAGAGSKEGMSGVRGKRFSKMVKKGADLLGSFPSLASSLEGEGIERSLPKGKGAAAAKGSI